MEQQTDVMDGTHDLRGVTDHTQNNPMDETQPIDGDVPDISKQSPERVDEAQEVLREADQGLASDEAMYVRTRNDNRIQDLSDIFGTFNANLSSLPAPIQDSLEAFHERITQALTERVGVLQQLRVQNEHLEQRLKVFHDLFHAAHGECKSIVEGCADEADADQRGGAHAAEQLQDPTAEQQPADAAMGEAATGEAATGEADENESYSANMNEYKTQTPSPDGKQQHTPQSHTSADSSDSSRESLKRSLAAATSEAGSDATSTQGGKVVGALAVGQDEED